MRSQIHASTSSEQFGTELRAPDFSLRQISYFVAVAQHQSLQKAADSLHVSAPAISAAIASLETTLDVQLFLRRHARGLLLTEAGSAFAIECRNLLQDAWQLGSGRVGNGGDVHGRIHVGCLFSFAPFIVPALLREISQRFPRVRLVWHEGHHEYLLEGLQTGAFDLAVTYDFDIPSGISTIPLRPAPLRVVVPEGHRLLQNQRATLAELATEPLILLDLPRTREYMLSAFSGEGVAPRIAHRVHSMGMLLGLVQEGHGYSLLNFCPPHALSFPLQSNHRTPSLVVAHSHRYRLGRTAAAIVECVDALADRLSFSGK